MTHVWEEGAGQSLCVTESVTGEDLPPVCRP